MELVHKGLEEEAVRWQLGRLAIDLSIRLENFKSSTLSQTQGSGKRSATYLVSARNFSNSAASKACAFINAGINSWRDL